jgi:AICAR transformylase/IMP cyclohydrolase PurH
VFLRYGLNPQQATASAEPVSPGQAPLRVLRGEPSYINLLDALNSWQLVQQAARALGRPTAASFKHVSPAGAAAAGPVDEVTAELYGVDRANVGELTSAYLRARDADPKSGSSLPSVGPDRNVHVRPGRGRV